MSHRWWHCFAVQTPPSPLSRDSDRDHSMREYEELQKLLEDKQKVELDKSERKELSIAAKRLDTGGK